MNDIVSGRRRRFVDEYVKDFNATQAATRAGYSPRSAHVTGCRLLKDAKVLQEIERQQSIASYGSSMTRAGMLSTLGSIIEDKTVSADARLRALTLVGKMIGMF